MATMPWKETVAVKERVRFLLEWERRWKEGEGRMNFAELCREYGVSRQVGYEWIGRYREANHTSESPRSVRGGHIRCRRRCPTSSRTSSSHCAKPIRLGDRRSYALARSITNPTSTCPRRAPSAKCCADVDLRPARCRDRGVRRRHVRLSRMSPVRTRRGASTSKHTSGWATDRSASR